MTFRILMALAADANHGYGLYLQVAKDAHPQRLVYDWAVYRELPKLLQRQLIEEFKPSTKPIRYRITQAGRNYLIWEQAGLREIELILKERLR